MWRKSIVFVVFQRRAHRAPNLPPDRRDRLAPLGFSGKPPPTPRPQPDTIMELDPQLAQSLQELLGSRFSQSPSDRDLHGRDESALSAPPPDAVVWPRSTEEDSMSPARG